METLSSEDAIENDGYEQSQTQSDEENFKDVDFDDL